MGYKLHNISVLVVEDNQPMLEVTKSLLLAFGVGHVIDAKDGDIGFKRFCEFNPDIVIADWMMKPMDGIELTHLIRSDDKSPNPYVPVLLMTGFSERRRVIEARDAGVTEFLVKPFNARDIYKRIVQIIERPRQFVKSEDFFGPDRRRKRRMQYDGPYRRIVDVQDPDVVTELRKQKAEAIANLDKIREDAGIEKGDKFDLIMQDKKGGVTEL